jgi:hypothetical protein
MNAVFDHIVQSYHSLWSCRMHGNSIEVITPASTTNDMFVSIFITRKGDEYIVTDGGWINDGYYGITIGEDVPCYNRLFSYYYNFHQIKMAKGEGKIMYYKKTADKKLIPNLVYDLSGFISIVVSSSLIEFVDAKESENIKQFNKQARDYLAGIVEKKHIKFNSGIDEEKFKYIKFGAVITKKNRLHLVNYITGSNESYFIGSIGKANLNFELIDNSSFAGFVDAKIAIINNSAPGYKPDKLSGYIDFMKNKSGLVGVNWSEKERINQLLN